MKVADILTIADENKTIELRNEDGHALDVYNGRDSIEDVWTIFDVVRISAENDSIVIII